MQTAIQLAEFIKMLDSFKEGDSTLLDQTLVIANTDNVTPGGLHPSG